MSSGLTPSKRTTLLKVRLDSGKRMTNWAGNLVYAAANLHEPHSVAELQEIVHASRSLRPLGSRHSFNDVADTTGDLVSLRHLPRIFEIDSVAATVTIDGGTHYGELCGPLHAAGYALHNLASLPHISVAGACATATHGSGNRLGNLATAVTAMEMVNADGELEALSRLNEPDVFDGMVVALGGLGVVTRLTLDVQPTFEMRQDLYEALPLTRVLDHFDEITALADSVSLFTTWQGPTFEQVWLKRRAVAAETVAPHDTMFDASLARVPLHPISGASTDACTEQLGVPGPWHERMPHFRIEHTPSSGDELQTEYLIPREHAAAMLSALSEVRDQFRQLVQISEVRTVAADRLWLSTAYDRDSVAIHFTWLPDWDRVRKVLPVIENALAPFDPRPHWGKLFTMPPESVRSSYAQLQPFVELLERRDPNRTFRNAFLDRYVISR